MKAIELAKRGTNSSFFKWFRHFPTPVFTQLFWVRIPLGPPRLRSSPKFTERPAVSLGVFTNGKIPRLDSVDGGPAAQSVAVDAARLLNTELWSKLPYLGYIYLQCRTAGITTANICVICSESEPHNQAIERQAIYHFSKQTIQTTRL